MALTVAQTVRELERLKHQRAVWMETVEHLSRFIDKETRGADHGIVAEGCATNPVPQSVVREFIDQINEVEIEPLNLKIDELENLYVKEDEEEDGPKQGDQRHQSQGATKKGALKKRRPQGGSKKDGPQGRVRAGPRVVGQKS